MNIKRREVKDGKLKHSYNGWSIYSNKNKDIKYTCYYFMGDRTLGCVSVHKSRDLNWIKRLLDSYDKENGIIHIPCIA